MAVPRKYPDELRERAIRLAVDARRDPAPGQEVVCRLTARGTSIRDIAVQLGTTKRTVSRRRSSFGAA